MTLIVGIAEAFGSVWMGSDSGITCTDGTNEYAAHAKVFAAPTRNINFILGYTGNVRTLQVLRYVVVPRIADVPSGDYVQMHWLVTHFYHMVHDALAEFGVVKADEQLNIGGMMMVGINERLYTIDEFFEVVHCERGYDAMGSGKHIALGSLYQTDSMRDMPTQTRIHQALRAANAHMSHIVPPYTVINTRERVSTVIPDTDFILDS